MTAEPELLDPPIVIWDGECGFCRRWVNHWEHLVDNNVRFVPFQDAAEGELDRWGLDPVVCGQAMHFVDRDEVVHRGAAAVLTLLRRVAIRFRLLHLAYTRLPGFGAVTDTVYGFVATHRVAAAKTTRLFVGTPHQETFRFAQKAFMRLLALASFVAFWSLWRQVDGLFASTGILPIADFLAVVEEHAASQADGGSGFWLAPSVFWSGASDTALRVAAAAGMVGSGLLFAGVFPRLLAILLWGGYLSFVATGQVFMGYQWDALLLESLLVGVLFLPAQLWPGGPGADRDPWWVGRWLVWVLLFKLMMLSGWVKWQADEVWRNLSALDFHFWTQPIPNFIAPIVHSMPDWVLSLGVAFTLVAESFAPLLIFAPRRARHLGAGLMIALQVSIALTGTYGFFNLLTIALCVSLFDDQFWTGITRGRWSADSAPRPSRATPAAAAVLLIGAALVLTPMSQRVLGVPEQGGALDMTRFASSLRSFNGYGLFANMTEDRPEVVVEGSMDGETWFTYDFRWKPTDLDEPLRFTTLHMPRVDWQMWFASLGSCARNRWFHAFAHRLLLGQPEVIALLESPPPQTPTFLRSRRFQYRFGEDTTWVREAPETYCPTFALNGQGELVVVTP